MFKGKYPLLIFISAIFFFIPFLGNVHLFDWDEINFAESAREMIVTGDYSRVRINFEPFWEKPPLFFWMQSVSMHLFGINEFAARFPNAICGLVTLITFFIIGSKYKDEKFGWIWAICYLGSFLPHLYFKSGIIDPWFNYFIFMTIYFLYKSINETNSKKATQLSLLAGLFIGLATLTKGPVGILITILTLLVYWIYNRFRLFSSFKNIALFTIVAILVTSLWFGFELIKNGPWFLQEFIAYQIDLFLNPVAGHAQPLYYHFLVVFLGCFPISIFAVPILIRKENSNAEIDFKRWMKFLFWVVMILFTIVKTKIVHYSSMAYFPLSFLAANYIYSISVNHNTIKKYVYYLLLIIGSIFSMLLTLAPLIANFKDQIIPYIKDPFAVASLQVAVEWQGWEFAIGLTYWIVLIISILRLKKNQSLQNVSSIMYATAFCMFFYLVVVVPKIEKYSQATAVNFYEKMKGKDVYVSTYGFKSYAQYFYFQKPNYNNKLSSDETWLTHGKVDKDVYLVVKLNNKHKFDTMPQFNLVNEGGGFLFYHRDLVK